MITSWDLNNGAKLVVEKIPYLRSAAIGFFVKVGSRHEPKDLAGVSHFVEHMIFKGTDSRSAREIAESFEQMGGQLNAFTSKEYTCVYGRTLDEDINEALKIIIDMLMNAQMKEKDMEVEKEVVLEEINMYEDTPDELIHDVFNQQLWQNHAMGVSILGTLDSVANFDRDLVNEFYHQNYAPSNMIIAVAGNVDENKIRDYIEENLTESRMNIENQSGHVHPPQYVPFVHGLAKDTEQVQLCVGITGLSYYDDKRYTLNVLNSILGGGMGSRLFQSIREELGLAYSVYSSHAAYSDTGSFSILIGTSPNKVDKFFSALRREIDGFLRFGVTEEEIIRTHKLMKSSMYLSLESVINRMNRLGKSVLMYDKVVTPEEVIEKIMKVNGEKVQELAKELLEQQPLSLAAIGNDEALSLVSASFDKNWRN